MQRFVVQIPRATLVITVVCINGKISRVVCLSADVRRSRNVIQIDQATPRQHLGSNLPNFITHSDITSVMRLPSFVKASCYRKDADTKMD